MTKISVKNINAKQVLYSGFLTLSGMILESKKNAHL